MSIKAETLFGAAFLIALAFLAYCIFVLPPEHLRMASLHVQTIVANI